MNIQYCSDLHLEFPENKKYLQENPLKPTEEILLLAGDIIPFAAMSGANDFYDFVSDNFAQTYWIPGNHEYYHSDINNRSGVLHEKIRSNVHLVNNKFIDHQNFRLVFTTLWSNISPAKEWTIQRSMADFFVIKNKGKVFTAFDYNHLHATCKDFLTNTLQLKTEKPTIVVTHHIPTFLNYPEKYRESDLNEAFAVELFDVIESSKVNYWIYGHHHQRIPDFKIGNTILANNQLGYVNYRKHRGFVFDKTIAI